MVKITIAGNAQKVGTHEKRHAFGNRLKGLFAVRKMTAVFPEKVSDKRFSGIFIAGRTHEKVLKFCRHSAYIEHAVGALNPFKVKSYNVHIVAKKEIGRRCSNVFGGR